MNREKVSTEFDCRRISVIFHRSASDKLAVVHPSCLFGAESYSGLKRERASGKVSNQYYNMQNDIEISFFECSPNIPNGLSRR